MSQFDDRIERLTDPHDVQLRFGGTVVREPTAGSRGRLGQYGNATLCKHEYPIENPRHDLQEQIEYEDRNPGLRGFLETTIAIGGRSVSSYNIHLALTESQRVRRVTAELAWRPPQTDRLQFRDLGCTVIDTTVVRTTALDRLPIESMLEVSVSDG